MSTTHGRIGLLLAGGRGVRLGAGVPKALASFGDRTLLAHACATLAACTERVFVIAPAGLELGAVPGTRLDDPPGGTGPLGALVAGLGAVRFDEACVLAVDLPGVTPAHLRALRDLRGGAVAAIAGPEGRPQPLVGWYSEAAVAPITRAWAAGERSVTRAVLDAGARVVTGAELPGTSGDWLNVNTPDDLAIAVAHFAAGGVR